MRNRRFYGLSLSLGLALSATVLMAQVNLAKPAPMSPQVERGKALFLNSPGKTACGTCHSIGGVGTAVGPDLKKIASVVGPRGLISTIQMSMTAYVQEYKIKDLGTFPGIAKEGTGGSQIYDLSKNPPELHEVKAGDIQSQHQNEKWQHPPAKASYTTQEMADLIAWLKYAATGSVKEVKPTDLE